MTHPLLLEALTIRQAALISGLVMALALGLTYPDEPAGVAAMLFYPPLAINALIDARTKQLVKNWTHLAGLVAIGSSFYFQRAGPAAVNFVIVTLPMLAIARLPEIVSAVSGVVAWLRQLVRCDAQAGIETQTRPRAQPSGMGMGDVRLASVLGLWAGIWGDWTGAAVLIGAFAGQALYAILQMALGRANWASTQAMGPWLFGASWLTFAVQYSGH